MSEFDKFWDLLDTVDPADRRCPKCQGVDCKYGTHSFFHRGFSLSIQCNDCHHSEKSNANDCENIIYNWHKSKLPEV